jgi:hypothetical protein
LACERPQNWKQIQNSLDRDEHLKDVDAFISDMKQYANLLQTMRAFKKGTNNAQVKLNLENKPEVLFILANDNPRSPKLRGSQ